MGKLLFNIYKSISYIGILFAFVFSFFSKTRSFTKKSFKKRLFPDLPRFKEKTILFHCASLGELNSAKEMIETLKKKFPRNPIIITTFTETAIESAKKITENSFLIPFDIQKTVKKFLNKANPGMVFISETEIWPIFISESAKKCKVYYINARMSEKTFKFYRFISPLIKHTFKNIERFFAQDKKSYDLLINFVEEKKLLLCGNTKYDNLKETTPEFSFEKEINKLDLKNKKIITFGSVHPDEAEKIIKSLILLKKQIKEIRYVLVPRHIEKTKEFEDVIRKFEIKYAVLSKISEDPFKDLYDTELLLADKLGVLLYFYSISALAFVGGTLNRVGGHNLLEPSVFSKPVLFGPNYLSQKESAEKLLENGGGFVVSDEYDLKARISVILSDDKKLKEIGEKSNQTLKSLQGATQKIIKEIWK